MDRSRQQKCSSEGCVFVLVRSTWGEKAEVLDADLDAKTRFGPAGPTQRFDHQHRSDGLQTRVAAA
jgi:hypothetical protein